VDPLKRNLLSVATAARLLCVTTVTVRRMLQDGRLSGEVIAGRQVVHLTSVDNLFAQMYPDYVRREAHEEE
jgi:excisionase family DNA binding protein